jgi:hypothetical protein
MKMRALSVRQLWAWAIIHAGKDIENRSWRTHYRGEVAIHASSKIDENAKLPRGSLKPAEENLIFSEIIGLVDLVDVIESSRSKWFGGPFGYVLTNPRPLSKPIPCKGALGIWNVPLEIERLIRRQLPKG